MKSTYVSVISWTINRQLDKCCAVFAEDSLDDKACHKCIPERCLPVQN